MKTKIQIKTITGDLLFEFEDEDNSIRHTVEEAVRQSISLSRADLRGADISFAYLEGVNLIRANLRGANFIYANLRDANLRGADLRGADLRGTNLIDADFRDAKNIPFMPTYLPEGEFIAWKKLPNGLIVKLKILEDSRRSRAAGDKCRCDKALVIEFQQINEI